MRRRRPLNLEPLEGRSLLSGLTAQITTDASVYQVGQPVNLTFTETNTSSKPIKVEEGPSIDGFVVTQGGSIVWQSDAGVSAQYIILDTLQPGQSLTLTATWNGEANGASSGSAVETGTFVAYDQLRPQTTVTFQIGSSSTSPTAPSSPTPPIPVPPAHPVAASPSPPPNATATAASPSPSPSATATAASPTTPSSPGSPTPTPAGSVSSPNPTPITTTAVANTSSGKHKHPIHHHTHDQVAKHARAPQLMVKVHHARPGEN
jgi:Intracellular proteinase inhibitor